MDASSIVNFVHSIEFDNEKFEERGSFPENEMLSTV